MRGHDSHRIKLYKFVKQIRLYRFMMIRYTVYQFIQLTFWIFMAVAGLETIDAYACKKMAAGD